MRRQSQPPQSSAIAAQLPTAPEAIQRALATLLAPMMGQAAAPIAEPAEGLKDDRDADTEPAQKLAYTIASFCKAHEISVPTFYRMRNAGKGPAMMQVGADVRISHEAAAEWRRAREADYRGGQGRE